MKIIFIEPKSPGYHIYTKWGLPRLGTIQLATILKNHGHDVKVFIEEIADLDFSQIFSADAVGISTITSTAPRAYEIANQIKKTGIKVFMGGPHVSFLPDEALEHCDYVLKGETENIILSFIENIYSIETIKKIPNISYMDNGKVFHTESKPVHIELDKLPNPDLSLVQRSHKNDKDISITPIITSRGCPFGCNFCSVTQMFGRKYRFRSTKNVIQELKEKKPEWVFFYDDNFTASPKRTKELLREMIRNDITPPWSAQTRIDISKDRELLKLMRAANCHYIYIGLESVNPDTLKALNKDQTVDEIEDAIKKIHREGINIHGMFILGADHDDRKTIAETLKFAKRLDLTSVQFMILTPLPGTEVYYKLEREGRLISKDWGYYDAHHVVFKPKKIGLFELQKETLKATLKFYSITRVLSCLNRFEIWRMAIRAYGHRMSKKMRAPNNDFLQQLNSFYHSTGENLHNIQLKARKTSEDLKEFFQRSDFKELIQKVNLKK